MARRYGKVTVTGWIEEVAGEWMVFYAKEGICSLLGSASRPIFHLGPRPEVEFLPEPVVFKDGDALRSVDGTWVWGRHDGMWHKAFLGVSQWSDDEMASLLRAGRVVRLVAEGATDAG